MKYLLFALVLGLALGLTPATAKPADNKDHLAQVYYLKIPRGDAPTLLNQLAHQTDTVLIYSYDQIKHFQANAIYGYFTLLQALDYMLLDTGLVANVSVQGIKITAINEQRTQNVALIDNSASEQLTAAVAQTEVIKVDGRRPATVQAKEIKLHAKSIVDALVVDDLIPLVDITVAESLARVPGIQVTRLNDEVVNVQIRGFADFTTTYNGREFFTAQQRRGSLRDFPTQVISSVEVHKSATADKVESGHSGLLNVQTLRPFELEAGRFSIGLTGKYNDQNDKISHISNLFYSDKWQSDFGQFGLLTSLSHNFSNYQNGVSYNAGWFPTTIEGFVMPAQVGLYANAGERQRDSLVAALQWQPTNQLQIHLDILQQRYANQHLFDNIMFHLTDSDETFGEPNFDHIEFVANSENQQISHVEKTAGRPAWSYRSAQVGKTSTDQYALGASWQMDAIQWQTELAYTDSKYNLHEWSLDSAFASPKQLKVDFFAKQQPRIQVDNFQAWDAEQYLLRGYFQAKYQADSQGVQWRLDANYSANGQYLQAVKSGVRYSSRQAHREYGNRYASLLNLQRPLTELDFLDFTLTNKPYRKLNSNFQQYMVPTRQSIIEQTTQLTNTAIDGLEQLTAQGDDIAQGQLLTWQNSDISSNPASYFAASEQTYAWYGQQQYAVDLENISFDINLGVRLVRTETELNAYTLAFNQPANSSNTNSFENSYNHYLPSLNIKSNLTDNLIVRLGAIKTLSRPSFELLNSTVNFTQVLNVDPGNLAEGIDAYATAGDIKLKPVSSINTDLTLEYYFVEAAYVHADIFYRDIDNFIRQQTQLQLVEQIGLVEVFKPINAAKAWIKGFELGGKTQFWFLPDFWQNFGLNANATYQAGFMRENLHDATVVRQAEGLADWVGSVALFYKSEELQAKLQYQYTGEQIAWYSTESSEYFAGNKIAPQSKLDFSARYKLTDKWYLNIAISNILAKPFRNYNHYGEKLFYPQDVRDEGRYYSLGFRFNY